MAVRRTTAGRQNGRTAERERNGTARRVVVLAVVLPLFLPRPAAAQEQPATPIDTRPWFADVSHYGKWAALAGAAGLTAVAIMRNHDADQVYAGLGVLCRVGGTTCVLGPDGRYLNPDAEALYQETLRLDSNARKWMLGGQVALVAAGTMFVVDLVAGTKRPKNIPYAPLEYFSDGRKVGLRVRF